MGKNIGTGGLAQGKILGRLAFYTWVIILVIDFTINYLFMSQGDKDPKPGL